jgi:hypothetical protein
MSLGSDCGRSTCNKKTRSANRFQLLNLNQSSCQMPVGPDNRNGTHARLEDLRVRLQRIHSSLADFQPLTAKPPILDSSLDVDREDTEDRYWLQPEVVPGLKNLKDAVKRDLGVLEKVGPESPQKTHTVEDRHL